MSNLADNRAYFESIQDYFLERTGRGLMLSSRDLELLIGWRQSGATAQTVCRGIDDAVESLRGVPRDLHAVKRYVEPRLSENVSAAPVFRPHTSANPRAPQKQEDPWAVAIETLTDARAQVARPELAESFGEVMRRIRAAKETNADPWTVLFDLDDFLVRDVFDRLGEDERRRIDLEIEGQHGAHLSVMGDDAREQTMLESRRRALRARWEIPSLTDV